MSLLKFVFVFGVMAMSLRNLIAVTSEEIQKFHVATTPHRVDSSAEYGVTMDNIKKVKQTDTYGTLDPCIMACIFRKCNMIDDQGLFDIVKAEVFIKKYLLNEADQKKSIGIIFNCKAVNLREVTDGEKGCERDKLFFECFRPLKYMV